MCSNRYGSIPTHRIGKENAHGVSVHSSRHGQRGTKTSETIVPGVPYLGIVDKPWLDTNGERDHLRVLAPHNMILNAVGK
eukprot:11216821-Lingulodinium_polyedra.AAC.1